MTLKINEFYLAGLEAEFREDDSALPEAPMSRPDAPVDTLGAIPMLAVVVIATWLVLGAAAFVVMDRSGSDPCVGIDTMRLQHCSAVAQ
jgi:hypothetical protein